MTSAPPQYPDSATSAASTAIPRQSTAGPGYDPELPLRSSTEIQGDIIAGFKKDHVQLLFLKFGAPEAARTWLRTLRPRIATTRDVTTYNEEFRLAHRVTGGGDMERKKAIWRGISFTHAGLRALTDRDLFADAEPETALAVFREGSAARAGRLGDTGRDAPANWLFGDGADDPVHAVLTIAADEAEDLRSTLSWERREVATHQISIMFEQDGATLHGTRRGREHFGFKDGVSEPAVAGYDHRDPENPEWKKNRAGTRIIPPGEFVVNHPKVPLRENPSDPPPPQVQLPEWMTNGSFQVVRRLGQDVPGWWAQVTEQLAELKRQNAAPLGASVEWLAARLVGRWRSGVPVHKSPDADMPANADLSRDNNISFANDPDGRITPLCSHLRKTSPRDGLKLRENDTGFVDEKTNLDGRRIMRRGVPYGEPFDPAAGEKNGPDAPRGLVFVCYQSDLVRQFEFIQEGWIEAEDFPHRSPRVGCDPMTGSDTTVSFPDSEDLGTKGTVPLSFRQFVRTEGSVYTFTPSLTALAKLALGTLFDTGDRVLSAPCTLNAGDPPISSGKAQLRVQPNGNITVHDDAEVLVWESGTGDNGGSRLTLEPSGQIVLYNAFDERLWARPHQPVSGSALVIGADGDVSVKAPDGRIIWHTETAR
jgi:Dyp-type peroxidase family